MGNGISLEEEWVQTAVEQLSPRCNEFASGVLQNAVQPVVQKALSEDTKTPSGKILSGVDFAFERTNFGTIPPKITNLKTQKFEDEVDEKGHKKAVVIDFDIEYLGDCDISVKLMGIRSGVKDVQVAGRARVVLKPTTGKQLPFVGGIQFYFLDQPKVSFDLDGLADIADWSFLKRKIRKKLAEKTAETVVFPNKVLIPMAGSSMDPMKVKCFDPKGAFGVRIVRASGLPKKKGLRSLVGQDRPDGYVKVTVGATTFVTRVVKNKTDPEWDSEWYNFLLENACMGHNLRLDAYDEDSFSRDDYLGKVVAKVDELPQDGDQEVTVPLEDDLEENTGHKPTQISGDITFQTRWVPLEPTPTENVHMAVLSVFVYSCNNLVEFADGSPIPGDEGVPEVTQVHVAASGAVEAPKRSEERKNTQHPTFEEGFTFTYSGQQWQDSCVEININELETGGSFGTFTIPVAELVENPIRRKVSSISEDKPMMTITLSANIKFA